MELEQQMETILTSAQVSFLDQINLSLPTMYSKTVLGINRIHAITPFVTARNS